MSIQDSMCPLCGRPSPRGEVCGPCRVGKTQWLECPPRVQVVVCPTCGARREAGVWSEMPDEWDDTVQNLVRRALVIHPALQDTTVDLAVREKSANRSLVECTVRGRLFSVPVEGSCTVEVEQKKEQCDRCSLISGSYYEGIVQVRGTGRRPAPREIEESRRITDATLESMAAAGERLAFVSKWDEHRDGLDITVGSQRLGKEIASAITQSLGGRFTTHPKLVGEKAGKQIFRVTYSVRLPRYSRGDILVVRGRYAEVIGVEGRLFRCLDLESRAVKLVGEDQVERRAGRREDSSLLQVVFQDRDMLGLLDPETGTTHEVLSPRHGAFSPGTGVRVLFDGGTPVVLP